MYNPQALGIAPALLRHHSPGPSVINSVHHCVLKSNIFLSVSLLLLGLNYTIHITIVQTSWDILVLTTMLPSHYTDIIIYIYLYAQYISYVAM